MSARGLVDAADGEQQRGPVGEEARVGDRRRDVADAVERLLEVARRRGLEGGPDRARPVRARRKLVRRK